MRSGPRLPGSRSEGPLAVLDSGIGGLTVVRALRRRLPGEAIVYLGDTARGPYGAKSPATLERFALQAGAFLARFEPKLLLVACDATSAHGLAALQGAAPCPVMGVLEPGAAAAAAAKGPVGVLASPSTVSGGALEAAILARNAQAVVHSLASPLLAALVEEGWKDDPVTDTICRRYLNQLPFEVRTVLLACPSYPLLLPSLSRVRPDTVWLDSCEGAAQAVEGVLRGGLGYRTSSAEGGLRVLLTDPGPGFQAAGGRFLGEALASVESAEL